MKFDSETQKAGSSVKWEGACVWYSRKEAKRTQQNKNAACCILVILCVEFFFLVFVCAL